LIVDDDQDIRHGLNVRLRANDYDTVYAGDAIWAVSKAQKEKPDLVLLDIGLPGGDGFLVMKRMKALPSFEDVPIIVVSARDPLVNKDRALTAGAPAFLQKPVDNDHLLAAIRNALGESTGTGGGLYLRAA
jgi:DNA-binding response OmpR family regulator